MYLIPFNLKKILSKKGKPPQLTPDEQALWDKVLEWERPESARVAPGDRLFRDALKIYAYLEEEDLVPWERVKAIISQDKPIGDKAAMEPVPMNPSFKWLLSGAAVVAAFYVGGWIMNQFTPAPSNLVTANTASIKDSLQLPDGSFVWLNKTSTIQYLKRHFGNGRSVDLDGEAYFKVKSDSANTFTVHTDGIRIIARGTEFNVNSSADDSTVITLTEGNLLIKTNEQDSSIRSGQQATVKNNVISISNTIDENKVLEWKNMIKLEGQTIQSVMEQISKYYKIDYSIEAGLTRSKLSGRISKGNSLEEVIKNLNDASGIIRFEIRNNRIIVSKK